MRRLAAISALLVLAVVAPRAFATSGSATDPNEAGVPDALDVVSVNHSNTATDITYQATVAASDPTTQADPKPFGIAWNLDFDGGAAFDACVAIALDNSSVGATINTPRGIVLKNGCPMTTPDTADFITFATATRSGNVFSITWPRSALSSIAAATGKTSYKYVVGARQTPTTGSPVDDLVPDNAPTGTITHDLSVATASPTASPTATPTASPSDDDDNDVSDAPSITLFDSEGNATTQFSAGEAGEVRALRLARDTNHEVLFGQSPDEVIGAGRSNALGVLRAPFRIPATARAGPARITLDPETGTSRAVPITIVSGAVGTGGTTLPKTGSEVGDLFRTGAILVAAGAVLMTAAQARRRPVHAGTGSTDLLFGPGGPPHYSGG